MNEIKQFKKTILFTILIAISFYFLLLNLSYVLGMISYLFSVIYPFLFGAAIAFILNIPMKTFEKKLKMKRVLAFFLTLICFVAILFLVLFLVIPELMNTMNALIVQIPKAFYSIQELIEQYEEQLPVFVEVSESLNVNWNKISEEAVAFIQSVGTGVLNSTFSIVSGITSAVITFFVGFTFSIYVLFQKEKLAVQMKKILYAFCPIPFSEKVIKVTTLTRQTFEHFLSGQCVEAIILGSLFFLTMSIFKLPYALLVGVAIAVTALIPVFGAFIGLLIGTFLIVMVNPMQALGFVVLFLVLQQLEGNLIYPYVVGGSVGLPSIWVLAAVTIGGKLFGIIGMFLFIPICSVLYFLFREYVITRIEKKEIPKEKLEGNES